VTNIQVGIDSKDLNKAVLWLAAIQGQLPYATSRALNDAAKEAVKDLNASTTQYFDRPTAFTKRGYSVTGYSNKSNLEATLDIRPIQAAYLIPSIVGGVRPQRPSERKTPGIAAWRPGSNAKLNASGNISKAQAVKALKGGAAFFSLRDQRGKLGPGIYQRMAKGKIRNVLRFNALPNIKRRWPVDRIANKSVSRYLPGRLNYWMEQAIKPK
jgi:hypothetical protein